MVRFGFIDHHVFGTTPGDIVFNNFPQFDVIKQDIADSNQAAIAVNRQNIRSALHLQKAVTSLDFNFVDKATLSLIRKVMQNYEWPKIFMKHPSTWVDGVDGYLLDYSGKKLASPPTNPNKVLYKNDTDDPDEGVTGATEIGASAYQDIGDIDNQQISVTTVNYKYAYFFFKWFPSVAFDLLPTQRVTMMLHHPWAYNNSGSNHQGFKIDVYSYGRDTWTEVSRMNYTMPVASANGNPSYQHFSILKPLSTVEESFRSWTEYYDSSSGNPLLFRMRTLDDGDGAVKLGFNYVCLLIDGWPVSWSDMESFNFVSSFTGAGYQGKMTLTEL